MKFTFTKSEIETVINLIPAYHAGANINKIMADLQQAERSGEVVETPMYTVSYGADGSTINISESAVVDSVMMMHRVIHPVVGDLKAAYRLFKGAADMMLAKFKEESKAFNKRYGVHYRYDLYEIADPMDARFRVVFGIAVPMNAKGLKAREQYNCHRSEVRWDKKDSLRSVGEATLIGSFDNPDELRDAAIKINLYKG